MQHTKGKNKLILQSYVLQTGKNTNIYTEIDFCTRHDSKLLSIMSYNNEATES